jgi:hypothetical protein
MTNKMARNHRIRQMLISAMWRLCDTETPETVVETMDATKLIWDALQTMIARGNR